jgi:stage V sporulation protein B
LLGAGLGLGVFGSITGFASAAVVILLVALAMVGLGTRGQKLPLERWTSFMRPIWIYQAFLNGILLVDVLVMKGALATIATEGGATAEDAARIASENVGIYSAAQKFAFVPYQLMLSLTFIVFPMVSRATSQGDSEGAKRTIQEAVRFALIVLVCVAAPVAGASSGVLRIAYPEEYVAGAGALAIQAAGAAAFALFVITSTALSGAGRPGLAAQITAACFLVVVFGNYGLLRVVGIGEHTLEAAALGTSAGMVLALVAGAFIVHRLLGGFVALWTAVRVGVAGVAAFFVARFVPHDTRVMALVALAAGATAFLAGLVVLREVSMADVGKIRKALGR